jgi:DNA-binding transcriptional LysR family regulator
MEIFLTLAEELHFGRTADRLNLSTARISQTIKRLERRFGVVLFERTSRRVELTATGARLRDDLHEITRQLDDAEDRAAAAGRGLRGTLTVGFMGARAGRLMLRAAARLRADHPECDISVRESPLRSATDELRSGAIQLLTVMLAVRDPDFSQSPVLFTEPRGLAVPAEHRFAGRDAITVDDLRSAGLMRPTTGPLDDWDRNLMADLPRPGPVFETIEEMLAMVGAGLGSCLVPEGAHHYYGRPDISYLPILDAPPYRWGLIWRTAADNERIRSFVRSCASLTDES